MNKLESKAAAVVSEWKAICGGCLNPNISTVPLDLLAGYIRRALEGERKECASLVKAALDSTDDRDFEWGDKLLKSMRSRASKR